MTVFLLVVILYLMPALATFAVVVWHFGEDFTGRTGVMAIAAIVIPFMNWGMPIFYVMDVTFTAMGKFLDGDNK